MNDLFQDVFTLAVILVSAPAWIAIGRKILRREPLVPYEGRRPVPWKTGDVAAILGVYFLPLLLGLAVFAFQGPSDEELALDPNISLPATAEAADGEEVGLDSQVVREAIEREINRIRTTEISASEEVDTHHSAIDLLLQDGTVLTWVLCFVAAVIVAPVAEEFLFRLVLQGWLESVEHRGRRQGMRRLARGAQPILVSSLLFAAIHFRLAEPAADPDHLRTAFAAQICWSLLVVVYAVAWLRFRIPDLTAADLGIDPRRIKSDIGLGLVTFLAVACPIYLLQFVLTSFWPNMVPDPISLFFLALALGFLYYRTHRLLPSIVLHMALNGASLLMVWLFLSRTAGS